MSISHASSKFITGRKVRSPLMVAVNKDCGKAINGSGLVLNMIRFSLSKGNVK
jgi:hypothetical protein